MLPSPDLISCRDRLARRVFDRVGPAGLVDAPCESRVLESALLLSLLEAERIAPDAAARLRHYLRTTLDTSPPDAVQAAFGRAALGEIVPGSTIVRETLSSFAHYTADRKRLMFQTLLAELGAADFPAVPLTAFNSYDKPNWLPLQTRALMIMAAWGTGTPNAITEDDWATLLPAVRPGPVWEGNHFARLVSLLALRKHPGHRQAVRDTLHRIAVHDLRPDGGVPFITGLDLFATAIAGIGLAGIRPGTAPLTDMADAFAAHQQPDGGFCYATGVAQTDVEDTSYGIEFLRAAAPRQHARTIAAAEHYLLAQRNADGGFPTYAHGSPSDVVMTAAAVNALAPNPAHQLTVQQSVAYISEQTKAGDFIARSWSRSDTNTVFRVSLACAPLPRSAPAQLREAAAATRRRLARYLADTQHSDGGWGHDKDDSSDPISTAYAVIALAHLPEETTVLSRALRYLITEQQPDGGYTSKPDQAGPRPVLYRAPALTDVCVLLAFAHATPSCGVSAAGDDHRPADAGGPGPDRGEHLHNAM